MSHSVIADDLVDPVWDPVKEIIRTLYLVENRNLKEVRSKMATEYQFLATYVWLRQSLP